jgi:putative nucleotidyltransferase with HDIG domain
LKKRYTIALLSNIFIGDYNYPLWRGIIDRTESRDINLISVSLSPALLHENIETIREYIKTIILKNNIDGLIISGGLLVQNIGYEEVYNISKNLFSFPVVNVGVNYQDIPSLIVDNYSGMYAITEHLLTYHRYSHIAYIRGTEGNKEENDRFHGYKDALQAYSVPFTPEFVSSHHSWNHHDNGVEIIAELEKKCNLEVDAIICSNDFFAISIMDELKRRNRPCPEQLAITGFDNTSSAAHLEFLLTTCSNPTYRMGIKSVDTLLNLMRGKTAPKDVIKIPSELIIRHSCGCFPASFQPVHKKSHILTRAKLKEKPDIKVITYYFKKKVMHQIQEIDHAVFTSPHFERLINTLIKDILDNTPPETSSFISTFKEFIIYYIRGKDKNLNTIYFIMEEIYLIIKNLSFTPGQYWAFEHLYGEVWKIISFAGELIHVDQRSIMVQQSHDLYWANMGIATVLELDKMFEVLTKWLPHIGITSFYLVLYDEHDPSIAHLMMGYNEKGDIHKQIGSNSFPSTALLPEGIFSNNLPFSLLVEPLHVRTNHLGYVVMDTKRQEDFVYFTISLQISTFLKKTLVMKQLRRNMGNIIDTLVTTVESRDPYTAGHQKRVSDLARSIAIDMGLSPSMAETIRMAAQIHDIGKIAIPSEILSKPSRLTKIEYDFIKTHSRNGFEILKNIDFPGPVAQAVLQHHERLDGSGYPQGLTGDEILLEAKIITVADVVEAMSSHRPYRPELGIDLALAEIIKNKGILYDPAIVDSCVKLFKEEGFTFKKVH